MVGWISATQAPISVSTIKAESFAITRTVFAVIGSMSVAEDFERSLNCELVGYATAEGGNTWHLGVRTGFTIGHLTPAHHRESRKVRTQRL